MTAFTKATKKQARLRLALEAPSGWGKTYTALLVATQLLEGTGKRVAFLDSEGRGQGSASKYAHRFDFDVNEIGPPFNPDRIIESLGDAVADGYGAWICDSWSHFWTGQGGMLEIVDRVARTKYRGDSHRAWGDDAVNGLEQRVLDALLGAPLHVIVCARMKTDTVREEVQDGERTRTRIRKAGLKAVQREGFDYEFDLVGKFETPMVLTVDKTRLEDLLPPDTIIEKPAYLGAGATEAGKAFVPTLKTWLEDGSPVAMANEDQLKTIDTLCVELATARKVKPDDVRRVLATDLGTVSITALTDTQAAQALHVLAEWKKKIAAKASENGAGDKTATAEAVQEKLATA